MARGAPHVPVRLDSFFPALLRQVDLWGHYRAHVGGRLSLEFDLPQLLLIDGLEITQQ